MHSSRPTEIPRRAALHEAGHAAISHIAPGEAQSTSGSFGAQADGQGHDLYPHFVKEWGTYEEIGPHLRYFLAGMHAEILEEPGAPVPKWNAKEDLREAIRLAKLVTDYPPGQPQDVLDRACGEARQLVHDETEFIQKIADEIQTHGKVRGDQARQIVIDAYEATRPD